MGIPTVCHVRVTTAAADLGLEVLSVHPHLSLAGIRKYDKCRCLESVFTPQFAETTGMMTSAGAGNSNEDACGWSPAGATGVIAVGAVDSQMRRWYSSNWYLPTRYPFAVNICCT